MAGGLATLFKQWIEEQLRCRLATEQRARQPAHPIYNIPASTRSCTLLLHRRKVRKGEKVFFPRFEKKCRKKIKPQISSFIHHLRKQESGNHSKHFYGIRKQANFSEGPAPVGVSTTEKKKKKFRYFFTLRPQNVLHFVFSIGF